MSSSKVLSDIVKIPIGTLHEPLGENDATFLDGKLRIPQNPQGIIIFAHGSGSGRHSPRNQFVAEKLNEDGLATLLFDLLTADEEELDNQTRKLRFDIGLLSKRLISTINWITNNHDTKNLAVGLFGASTGAAAALVAAAELPNTVCAIVSRGGRPDLAGKDVLKSIRAPTLFLVGGNDPHVVELNENALEDMTTEKKKITLIPGATHLFEEPGKLEQLARIASGWFRCYFLIKKHKSH
ncbi:MAG TPA: alpha/beta family hydrolase [Candidatus Bathyarchaeia archaeon]|nr:alpha/beta family hydrolase [Candidatus Bathyarchaeia archaeon]